MGRRRKGELPRYRLHKQSGQAVVSLPLGNGKYRDVLLGAFDTDESKREYARVLDEWLAHGGQVLACRQSPGSADLSINELVLTYWPIAEEYYRHADGRGTTSAWPSAGSASGTATPRPARSTPWPWNHFGKP